MLGFSTLVNDTIARFDLLELITRFQSRFTFTDLDFIRLSSISHMRGKLCGPKTKLAVWFFTYLWYWLININNTIFFITPTVTIALSRQGTWLTKPDPPPKIMNPILGSWLTGGAILHWPIANEFHNSVPAQLSPFLGWVAFTFL